MLTLAELLYSASLIVLKRFGENLRKPLAAPPQGAAPPSPAHQLDTQLNSLDQ
jgi:hypothetical protein